MSPQSKNSLTDDIEYPMEERYVDPDYRPYHDEWDRYLLETEPMFDVIRERHVLEIGTAGGNFWPMMKRHYPASITGVDPDYRWEKLSATFFEEKDMIRGDIFNVLPTTKYDVIVCYGVIYKLHNTIELFERMATSQPDYILLEDLDDDRQDIGIYPIEYGKVGDWVPKFKCTAGRALRMPMDLITDIFDELGYDLERQRRAKYPLAPDKYSVCQFNFKRRE